jgi:glutamate dehydrogenase
MLLYTAKIDAQVQGSRNLVIDLKQEWEDRAIYIYSTNPGVLSMMHKADYRIDEKYLDHPSDGKVYQVESFLSTGSATHNMKTKLRCFFVNKCEFKYPNPNAEESRDIEKVADPILFDRISTETKERYQKIMLEALDQMGVIVDIVESPVDDDERILYIAYRRSATENFLAAITDLYDYHGYYSTKKFVDNFSNGISIMTAYLSPIPKFKVDSNAMSMIEKEVSMLFAIPNSPFQELFRKRLLDVQETMYATSAFVFVQHFLNRLGQEYWTIKGFLSDGNPHHQQLLGSLKKRLRGETFTVELIKDIVMKYPNLIKILYANFAEKTYIKQHRISMFAASVNRKRLSLVMQQDEMLDTIAKTVSGETEKSIFQAFTQFNENVVKTNFFNPAKVAFSYRFKCEFLPPSEYPIQPYGIFLIVGNEFRGFHVRFQDIARGGIRIVRSRNKEIYELNRRYLFDENYALASTQTRKNKDIPEGGSKGTILLNPGCQESSRIAFEKYIDSIQDLLVPEKGIGKLNSRKYVPEILFFGPDEGTADFMDWASEHAKKRGLKYWRAITTGKSQQRGGIPHDTYGMTTRSVNRYVQGIYRKLDLDESKITKFQTGGPDGDLGSNEIKMSKDMTIAIVDGSGVLYDSVGIERTELLRLANERKMISDFNRNLLSPQGFRVLVDENQVTLPDGTVVASGIEFRNTFHLNPMLVADIFVPCGGRPEAVDISNYQKLLLEDGTPRFKYIVEGANLFITQEARIRLEKAGCILFKDASANKGGVTSSSLEVLAALALTDDEFEKCMAVKNGVIPKFYSDYVKTVQEFIKTNADLEFECIWRESTIYTEKTKAEISDQLSLAILELKNQLKEDEALWEDEELRTYVLSMALPSLLQEKVGGIEVLLSRLPENYQKAVFGSCLASRFIYAYGIEPNQMAFFDYMTEYMDMGLDQEEKKIKEKLEEMQVA